MSEELAIQLHRLYRDYYDRRLDLEDYRYRRALLLDSLAGGAADFNSEDVTLPRRAEFDGAETDVVEPPAAESAGQAAALHFRWYYVLAACVPLVAGVAWFVTNQIDQPTRAAAGVEAPAAGVSESTEPLLPAGEPEPAEETVIVVPDAGQLLVEDFVARQDWREMSLLEFLDSWSRLPESDRIVAKGAVWFEPLSESLEYRIEEAREFAGDPATDQRLNQLYAFSVQLGLVELVPAGWKPQPADVNRGAGSMAPEPADRMAADTALPDRREVPETFEASPIEPEADTQAGPAPAEEARAAAAAAELPPASPAAAEAPSALPAAAEAPSASPAAAENPNACDAAQLETRRRNCFDLLSDGSNGPLMRVLPAGGFVMGSDERPEEQPVRNVSIAAPFAISVFEINAGEFRRFCEATGFPCPEEPWADDEMPVVDVSWHQAVAYSQWLSNETGHTYRLPTEEEWEYAARAGTTTDYPYGDKLLPAQARYSSIADYDSPLPASDRTTQRNEFELWHMVGNVREWVADDWSEAGATGIKAVRGGSFASDAGELRSAARIGLAANGKDRMTGFRLLREL